jgi:hypothetical protein
MSTEQAVVSGRVTEVAGDRVLRKLNETIARFELNEQQALLARELTRAQLPCIYGDDFHINERRILEENGIVDLQQMSFVCTLRRAGKTHCVAAWSACLLVCVPDTKIVLYSPGQRQSIHAMELIRKNLEFLKQFIDWEVVPGKSNEESFAIRVNDNRRLIECLSANESVTRGSGGTCVICDEAAAMPKSFFVRVILPTTAPAKTSCVCISSRESDYFEGGANWFSVMLDNAFPDGKPTFNTITLSC